MKIVIDCNRIIAALIKDSTTRSIIMDNFFEFIAPDFVLSEVRKHEEEIIKKANITNEELEILLALLFDTITIIPRTDYDHFLNDLTTEIKDQNDLPYLAVSMSEKADGIWSHDPHFQEQKKVKVLTNIDLLKISGKIKFSST